ncbi:hypothetical protein J1605_006476 [Eschrichtius robustus]|uniref:Uncharacterized protein n=1 Tax=Eschrichtius robustus TaxID=9764 RepID=A0AB34H3N0_ESCRO|nr:hypothetical protein J1605_006476 [Eschrichtius robustus]
MTPVFPDTVIGSRMGPGCTRGLCGDTEMEVVLLTPALEPEGLSGLERPPTRGSSPRGPLEPHSPCETGRGKAMTAWLEMVSVPSREVYKLGPEGPLDMGWGPGVSVLSTFRDFVRQALSPPALLRASGMEEVLSSRLDFPGTRAGQRCPLVAAAQPGSSTCDQCRGMDLDRWDGGRCSWRQGGPWYLMAAHERP